MKVIINAILIVLTFAWISTVSADKGSKKLIPESIVTCSSTGIYGVGAQSISASVNAELCETGSVCSPCISSLEAQGCKIVDVVVGSVGFVEFDDQVTVTYLFSCTKP